MSHISPSEDPIREEKLSSASLPYHIPALLSESLDILDIKPDGIYVDCTFGGGGHSRAILQRLGPDGRLFGFDRDIDAFSNAPDDPRFTFVHGDFRYLLNFMEFYGVEKVDGILADLGVSFHHFDTADRGFSFRSDSPLDMRMNRLGGVTAKTIVNEKSESELTDIFKRHTDLRNPGALAKAICIARRTRAISTTSHLVEVVKPVLSKKNFKKELAQVFQALRITTNDEFGSLERLLVSSLSILKRKGRIAILTYHSGEDRMVKDFFKTGSLTAEPDRDMLIYGKSRSPWKVLTPSPIVPTESEIARNPRSRSAKLRAAELKY